MKKAHSHIGASGAERWFACPGSVAACADLPNTESEYAFEGSRYHGLAAYCLEHGFNADRFLGWGVSDKDQIYKPGVGEQPEKGLLVTQEGAAAVQTYLNAVREIAQGKEMDVEVKFHLAHIHPDLYGTADCVIYDPKTYGLWVIDFKYGAGVVVDPEDNPQLLYYAVGAAFAKSNRVVKEVHLGIVQPRAMGADVKWWAVDAIDLLDFAETLREKVTATEADDAPRHAGEHCRFCPAAALCPKLAEVAEVAPVDEYKPGRAYDPEALSESLGRIKALNGWIKAVESFALSEMRRGAEIPGYKMVEKRAVRTWKDVDEAKRMLLGDGRAEAEIMEPACLRSPAQVEELVGKKTFAELVGEFVAATSSGVTYAPVSDKRPAVNKNHLADFAEMKTA